MPYGGCQKSVVPHEGHRKRRRCLRRADGNWASCVALPRTLVHGEASRVHLFQKNIHVLNGAGLIKLLSGVLGIKMLVFTSGWGFLGSCQLLQFVPPGKCRGYVLSARASGGRSRNLQEISHKYCHAAMCKNSIETSRGRNALLKRPCAICKMAWSMRNSASRYELQPSPPSAIGLRINLTTWALQSSKVCDKMLDGRPIDFFRLLDIFAVSWRLILSLSTVAKIVVVGEVGWGGAIAKNSSSLAHLPFCVPSFL